MRHMVRNLVCLGVFGGLLSLAIQAQVTTATLYGVVQDPSGAVIAGAQASAIHLATGQLRTAVADDRGEFALPALPVGAYRVVIEQPGFKTYNNEGIELTAGQTLRSTFVLEVGDVNESITVTDTPPLVETASAAQSESLGLREVADLPLARRNLVSLMTLSAGVTEASTGLAGGGNIRLNGVSEGGTLITIDGTDATGNQETRGANSYGGQNQISVMSIEAVAEVQEVKGVLPAEYGAVTGGQVNMISRSGTNEFHGSLFENFQNDKLFARDPFLPLSQAKPAVRFNQFGGSLGGPILRNRAFFFTTYEGYQERYGVTLSDQVPTQQLRDQILAALPSQDTQIVLDTMPLPNEAIDENVGRYRTARPRKRSDNTVLAKGDIQIADGNLSVTYSRMRPFTRNPSIYIGAGNDQRFNTKQDRIATQYVLSGPTWVSETRFGWNRNKLDRVNDFWSVVTPGAPDPADDVTVGFRVPQMILSGYFSTPTAEILQLKGRSFTFEQKVSRVMGQHNVKVGFRFARQGGSKTNPQDPILTFQSIDDLLANTPNSANFQLGIPPHDAHLDEYGVFVQDDWRVTPSLVLNLGLRYDYYPTFQVKPTTDRDAEIVNLEPLTDIRKLDFGGFRPADRPYEPDGNNFGPRAGFAWTVDRSGDTVVRGGIGFMFSPLMFATIQNTVTDPYVPQSVVWNRTDLEQRGIGWPSYGADIVNLVREESGGEKTIFSLIDANIRAPYSIQTMFSIQRSFFESWMVELGYVRTNGRNFPLHHYFGQAFDRETGERPNPALGTPGGYYITDEQTMTYNAMQLSIRKRLSGGLSLDIHYTLADGNALQGGGLSSNFVNGDIFVTQDFFNPEFDRSPLSQLPTHQINANIIYELPTLSTTNALVENIFNGWRASSIISIRSGVPLRLSQPSGISRSRPDLVSDSPVLSNSRDTLVYLDQNAFQKVPTYEITGATVRPGTANPFDIRGPNFATVDMSFGKNFSLTERANLELRLDAFNSFNHVNFNNPSGNINSPSFGRFTRMLGPRTMQIAARLAF